MAGGHLPPHSVRSPPALLLHSTCGRLTPVASVGLAPSRSPAATPTQLFRTQTPSRTHPSATPGYCLLLAPDCRHYLFEGRPLALFILHSGYHGVILAMSCALLCAFGGPQEGRSGAGAGAGRVARSEL